MRPEEVSAVLKEHFGIIGTVTQLVGERDLNFKVETADSVFIFKTHSAAEKELISIQELALARIAEQNEFQSPQTIKTLSDQSTVEISESHIGRLLTWLEGDLWDPKSSTKQLLHTLGLAVSRIDAQLANLSAEHEALLNRPFGWNVLQTAELVKSTALISDSEIRGLVETVLSEGVKRVLPKLKSLPSQVIHNDANENNIVVSAGQVVGLIDFGDMIFAPRVSSLGVACAYAMTSIDDPVLEILPLVRGYHQAAPLTAIELELLFDLIRIRVATSITMAAIQIAADPENEYLLISQEHFRALLRTLCATDPDLSHFRFRNACGFEGNPNSRAVRQWLQSGRAPIADVVMPSLGDTKKIWLDWSSDNQDIPRSDAQIVELMKASDAKLAIGHYCENRMVYEGEAFSIDSPNRRSVHLGVDLFAPAGTPVYAGHDGTVEYFNDNNVHLDYGPVIILRHETENHIPFWTLYGHLSRPSLENLSIGKVVKAGEQIATMGEEHENVGWPPHTHFQLLTSLCGMGLDVYGVAPLDELPLWRSISPNPNLILKISEGTDKHTHLRTEVLLEERQVVMSRALSLNFKNPLEIVRGEGAYLFDQSGNPYLDLVNNVAHVGHGHPRVVAAGAEQMARLNTNTRYVNQNAIEYARSLASTFPDPLNVVFFVNSGSEANDLALRLAQAHTGKRGMLVLDHAYHGHLSSIIDISPYKFNGRGGRGRPDHVRVVPLPDSYKGIHRGPDSGTKYAAEFAAQLTDLPMDLCAFISESIVSTAGQVTLAEGFLQSAYAQTRAAGGVCIADEVQIGMGRIGTGFWGFELHGVIPDIVTIGKPIGNGHPLAAVVTTPEIAHSFMTGMEYFNTFGGNPVSTAIGQAVLDVILDQDLQANAMRMGQRIKDGFNELAKSIEYIGDVRGSGLFLGVELVTDRQTQAPATEITSNLMEFAKNRGVFLSCDGPANNVLKIKPPMVLSDTDVDLFLTVVAEGLR